MLLLFFIKILDDAKCLAIAVELISQYNTQHVCNKHD